MEAIPTWPWWIGFCYVLLRALRVENVPTFESNETPSRNHALRIKTALFYVPFVPGLASLCPFLFQLFLSLMVFLALGEYNVILRVHLASLRSSLLGKGGSGKNRKLGIPERIVVASQPERFHETALKWMGLLLNLVVIYFPSIQMFGYLCCFWFYIFQRLGALMWSGESLTHVDYFEVMSAWFGFTWIVFTMSTHGIFIETYGNVAGTLLGIMILTSWFGDAAAYYVGKKFGKHKAFPNISPSKSLEGMLAEIVFGVCLAALLKKFEVYLVTSYAHSPSLPLPIAMPALSMLQYCIIGFLSAVLGIAGDACESFIKRMASVKDSGSFFPGHGGVLDRFDTFFFIGPFLYYAYMYFE